MTVPWKPEKLSELLRLQRRPVEIVHDKQYQEIGTYCFGGGIFHKTARLGAEIGDKKLFEIKKDDFILQVTFAWEGAVAIASQYDDGLFGSTRYPTYRVNEERCVPSYLLAYFRTDEGLRQLRKISPGSAGRNRVLSLKRLPEVLVPLPDVTRQRAIMKKIDALAVRVDEALTLRREALAECDALSRAVLAHATADLTPMRELVKPRSPDVIVHPDEMYQFAGVYSFGRGVFRAQRKSGQDFSYPRLTTLRTGDFVYPKLMAWEGALGVVPPACDGCVVSTEFPVFEIRTDRVLPEVLDTYFRTPSVWPTLSGESTGTNMRRRRLNPEDFLDYKIPLPSDGTQLRLRSIRAAMNPLAELQNGTTVALESINAAILDRAFKGEL